MKIGKTKWYIDHVFSTNEFLKKRLASKIIKPGELVFVEYQTSGQGQRGRKWYSEPGKNILFSFYLDFTKKSTDDVVKLSQEISLRTASFIEDYNINNVQIKWPNDILVNRKKVGGILIENQWMNQKLKSSIIGIGINLNQEKWEVEPLDREPSSIKLETKTEQDLSEARNQLISYFENFDIREQVQEQYLKKLYAYHEPVKLLDLASEKEFIGQIEDIDDQGRVIIWAENETKVYSNGEIKFL